MTSAPLAASSRRTRLELDDDERDSLCIGCHHYPEAPNYPNDWLSDFGMSDTIDALEDQRALEGDNLTPEEQVAALKINLLMAAHTFFNTVQGQACMDLCA